MVNQSMPSLGHKKSDNTESNDQIKELVYDHDSSKEEVTTKTNIASNLISGGDINITSENNNLISGSNLSATNNINLTSESGTTTITAAQDQISRSLAVTTQNYNDMSANYNRGRVSADSNSKVLEETTTTNTVTQKQSNLSAGNDIVVNSHGDINLLSSNLAAEDGDITLNSSVGNVNILALQNTTSTTKETKEGTLTLSVGIGNAHVDTAYAEYDALEAARNLADAKKELTHMKTLRDNGQADDEAVKDAEINLTIAVANLILAEMKLAASAKKSTASCATSACTGFYGDIKLNITGTKTNSNTTTATSVSSNLNAKNNILITSGLDLLPTAAELIAGTSGNTNITGSNINSADGDINITSKNNTTITASKDTLSQGTTSKTWTENLTLASSADGSGGALDNMVNNLAISLGAGISRTKSDTNSTIYNNSQLNALNGEIKITSLNNTKLSGINLTSEDITINTVNNLTVESLQNSYAHKDKTFGINLGGSGSGTVSGGINYATNKNDRLWVDNQSTIIGTNSVTINSGSNTNIIGAVIANITNANELLNSTGKAIGADAIDGGNLTLNTKTLTFQNLQDHEYNKSFGFNFSTSIGVGLDTNSQNQIQTLNFYPAGSTTIGLQNSSNKKEQETKATIGAGNITTNADIAFDSNGNPITITGGSAYADATARLNRDVTKTQVITKDMITGALDVSVTIDNRIIAAAFGNEAAQASLSSDQKNLLGNIVVSNTTLVTGTKDIITSAFDINSNDPKNDSYLEVLNNKTKLRYDAALNTQSLLQNAENAKYYNNPDDNKAGFYDPETGETYINLTYNKGTNSLMGTILHETSHQQNNLPRNVEEQIASNYSLQVSDLINFYHSKSEYSDSLTSQLVSWGYANSSLSNQYNSSNNYLNNFYTNNIEALTPVIIKVNNVAAGNVDQGKVETDVAFRLDGGERSPEGHTIGYYQNADGKWIEHQQGAIGEVNLLLALMNWGYPQGISLSPQYTISPTQRISISEERLRNDPKIVYIETSREQDVLIEQNIIQKYNNQEIVPYRLWTNNCNTSFASACAAAGVKLPEIVASPRDFHEALKLMYPKSNSK